MTVARRGGQIARKGLELDRPRDAGFRMAGDGTCIASGGDDCRTVYERLHRMGRRGRMRGGERGHKPHDGQACHDQMLPMTMHRFPHSFAGVADAKRLRGSSPPFRLPDKFILDLPLSPWTPLQGGIGPDVLLNSGNADRQRLVPPAGCLTQGLYASRRRRRCLGKYGV